MNEYIDTAAPSAPASGGVTKEWRAGAKFALQAVAKVDSLCWLTDSMREICLKQATNAVLAECDRLPASPTIEGESNG